MYNLIIFSHRNFRIKQNEGSELVSKQTNKHSKGKFETKSKRKLSVGE